MSNTTLHYTTPQHDIVPKTAPYKHQTTQHHTKSTHHRDMKTQPISQPNFLPQPFVGHLFRNSLHDSLSPLTVGTRRAHHGSSLSYYYLSWSPRVNLAGTPRSRFQADFRRHRRITTAESLTEWPEERGEDWCRHHVVSRSHYARCNSEGGNLGVIRDSYVHLVNLGDS